MDIKSKMPGGMILMTQKEWWREAAIYQIYPKSFQDSNGDGVGDLKGIIQRLDYIKELGIDAIWLCPIYCSPMKDNGYDISDYYHIDPSFGTDEDMEELISEAGKRDIKILMDLVANHTSDQHEWFKKAKEDPEGPYGKYYILKRGKEGKAPNNLRSYFGVPAWTPLGNEDWYYFNCFAKEQPDLNWNNEETRRAIYDIIEYWHKKGIAGFRIDAIGNVKKQFTKEFYEPDGEDGLCFLGEAVQNIPGLEIWLKEMDDAAFKPYNSMTVAEMAVPDERLKEAIGEDGVFRMVFDFSYTDIEVSETDEWYRPKAWTLADLKEKVYHSQMITQEAGWGCVHLENHDRPRSINKFLGDENINYYSITMLAMMFLFLRGTPFIYQGQEIGMTNIRMDSIEDYDDLSTISQYQRALQNGIDETEAWEAIYKKSRDNSRTPMQWDGSKNAGFSAADKTWLKVNSNYVDINVEKSKMEEKSVFEFYKTLLKLRKEGTYKNVLVEGLFAPEETEDPFVMNYRRYTESEELIVYLNYQDKESDVAVPLGFSERVAGNYDKADIVDGKYRLRPYECIAFYKQ